MKGKIKQIIKKYETKTKDVYIEKGIDANHYDKFIADLVKLFAIHVVNDSQFERYAEFCIECDRQGLKLIKYKDYLEIG